MILVTGAAGKTGQVIIQVRDVKGVSAGQGNEDNPFNWDEICKNISERLAQEGYKRGKEYEIMKVPNITNITYGRGVGYVLEEESFDSSIEDVSATKIRKKMREEGKLKPK